MKILQIKPKKILQWDFFALPPKPEASNSNIANPKTDSIKIKEGDLFLEPLVYRIKRRMLSVFGLAMFELLASGFGGKAKKSHWRIFFGFICSIFIFCCHDRK